MLSVEMIRSYMSNATTAGPGSVRTVLMVLITAQVAITGTWKLFELFVQLDANRIKPISDEVIERKEIAGDPISFNI